MQKMAGIGASSMMDSNDGDSNSKDMRESSDNLQNDGANPSDDRRKKRFRRTANAIERRFICWCGKAYGSEGSLNQHKKNKDHFVEHQDGYMMNEIAQHQAEPAQPQMREIPVQ